MWNFESLVGPDKLRKKSNKSWQAYKFNTNGFNGLISGWTDLFLALLKFRTCCHYILFKSMYRIYSIEWHVLRKTIINYQMLLEICFNQLRYQKHHYQVNIHSWSGISFGLHILKAHHFCFFANFLWKNTWISFKGWDGSKTLLCFHLQEKTGNYSWQ